MDQERREQEIEVENRVGEDSERWRPPESSGSGKSVFGSREAKVGILVFGTLSVLLILTAFGLGMAFAQGRMQGNGSYGIVLTVITLVTMVMILLSAKFNLIWLRLAGILISYVCFIPYVEVRGEVFLILCGISFLLNLICVSLPLPRYQELIGAVHMLAAAVFGAIAFAKTIQLPAFYPLLSVLAAFVILNLIFYCQIKNQREEKTGRKKRRENDANAFIYIVCLVFYGMIFCVSLMVIRESRLEPLVLMALILACAAFFLLFGKRPQKWYLYYFLQGVALVVYGFSQSPGDVMVFALASLLVSKALTGVKELCLNEALVTAFACLVLVLYPEQPSVWLLLSAVLLSTFLLHRWKTYYEVLIMLSVVGFVSTKLLLPLRPPVAMGLFLLGMLIFNDVPRWKDDGISIFNGFSLAGQVICLLALQNPVFDGAWITYFMMLVFGAATILLVFEERYGMKRKNKGLALAVFLTYLIFTSGLLKPVLVSVFLLLLAFACVEWGFWSRGKNLRIYGLLLSLVVCGKMLFFDFVECGMGLRAALLLVLGMVTLGIALNYMLWGKRI